MRKHPISESNCFVDVFLAGPSCVDLSTLNNARSDFAGSYKPSDGGSTKGASGTTYQHGFKQARLLEAVLYDETLYIT